jgi:hypothetical protein
VVFCFLRGEYGTMEYMKKVKEMIARMQTHYAAHKKNWIIGMIIGLVALLLIILGATGAFHKKHRYNAEGVEICAKGDLYDITTGEPCKGAKVSKPVRCAEGDKFDIKTGEPCPVEEEKATNTEEVSATKPVEDVAVTTPAVSTAAESTPTVDTAPVKATGSYAQALADNAGKALSYDDSCVASPKDITVAKNTLVMLANNGTKGGDPSTAPQRVTN